MKRNLIPIAVFLLLASPVTSFAWGATGHKIIAEIAFRYLDAQTRKNVLSYLNGMSIEEAANWMDQVRGDPAYDYMRPYHYADFDRGRPATAITGDNIIGILNSTLRDLENSKQLTREQIRTDLLYLLHLVGDLHQPLHVGYADDRGGNEYQISFLGNSSNLHKVWDSEIIDYKQAGVPEIRSAHPLSPEQIAAIQQIDIVSWANQSRGHLDRVYSVRGHKIDEAYIATSYPIIESQLLYAGLRLAAILQRYFSRLPAVPGPPAVSHSATITAFDATGHVGETLTVCGKVFGGKYLENSKGAPTLINMGADYPDNPFTVVIYGSDRGGFTYQPENYLPGKTICVTGLIKRFKGKPEIVVTRQDQIRLKEN
jgi:S1/P1 Nuclease